MHVQAGEFFPAFDYLRIMAAVGVYYSHALLGENVFPENFGSACVQLFFALSGFLIGNILVAPGFSPRRFYFNRTTRIWIPYFLALALIVIVSVTRQTPSDPKLWEFLFYKLTFVYNFFGVPQTVEFANRMPLLGSATHFWSISVEEQFYLIAPFLILAVPRMVLATLLIAMTALNVIVPHDFAAISLGLLLALSRESFGEWYARFRLPIAAAALSIFAGLALGSIPFQMAAPFIAVCIIAVTAVRGRQYTMGKILGGASYPFYLNHWIGLFAIKPIMHLLNVEHGIAVAIACIGTLTLSVIHFQLIDTWIARHRSEWYSERRGAVLCGMGFALVVTGVIGGLWLKI